MTLLILILGIAVPFTLLLIAPSVPWLRRMAEVDAPKNRRIHRSAAVLVIDEDGEPDFEPGVISIAQERSETYPLWWQRQPMRTDDRVLPVDELDLSPVAIIQRETPSGALDDKPIRFKVRDRTHALSNELSHIQMSVDS